MAAPTATVRRLVFERDGWKCLACGVTEGLEFQHRQAVGMGGTKHRPSPVEGIVLCSRHNQLVESNALFREWAVWQGWKIPRFVDSASRIPVFDGPEVAWYWLGEDGSRREGDEFSCVSALVERYGEPRLGIEGRLRRARQSKPDVSNLELAEYAATGFVENGGESC